jgi:phosphopantetheine adenylyltransferase
MSQQDLPSLLLLPYPPDPANRDAINAAYRPSLKAALSNIKRPSGPSRLIVAITCPLLNGQYLRSKTLSWPQAQSLIAGVYSLIAALCVQLSINTEVDGGPNSVDATVLLIDHSRSRHFPSDFRPAIEPNNTVVIDLPTFSQAYFPWCFIFHPRSELGLDIYHAYLKFFEGKQTLRQDQLIPVEAGLTFNVGSPNPSQQQQTPTYPTVCLGGTFDYLHPGHKLLLTAGALLLQVPREGDPPARYIIGITGDEMLRNKKFAEYLQPWSRRARNVISFLSQLLELSPRGWKDGLDGWETTTAVFTQDEDGNPAELKATFRNGSIEIVCVCIQDAFGPTITVENMQALVVSGETREGGKAVNEKRLEKGWNPLEVYEVDVLDAGGKEAAVAAAATTTNGFEAKISSTEIRKRRAERDRVGRVETKI